MYIAYLILLYFFAIPQQGDDDTLTPVMIDSSELYIYNDLNKLVDDNYKLLVLDSMQGFLIGQGIIGVKKNEQWVTWPQPVIELGINYDIKFDKATYVDINENGKPELVVRLSSQQYGSRGGTDYEYIQIWDVDIPSLIYSGITKEHFAWFSSADDEGLCQRNVTYGQGWINIPKYECKGDTSGYRCLEDKHVGRYQFKNGIFSK